MTTVVHLLSPEAGVASTHGRFVRIDRGTKWGNPYRIGKDGTREECIELFRQYLTASPTLMATLPELRDKVLGCWCKATGNHWAEGAFTHEGRACHGDVLAELVNAMFPAVLPWTAPTTT